MTVLINGYGILAFRDPHGVRPLCLGARPGGSESDSGMSTMGAGGHAGGGMVGGGVNGRGGTGKMDLAVASESAALTGLGFALRRDVHAGEAVFLDVRTGSVASRVCAVPPSGDMREGTGEQGDDDASDASEGRSRLRFKPCLFEYVYMARPDSIIDGVPVSMI